MGIGPIARRAEDLIAVLRIIAGPDGQDRYARKVKLGDPSTVSLDGLRVILTDHTTIRPISRDVLDARERAAGALVAAGAQGRTRVAALVARRGDPVSDDAQGVL